ncbi:hypothetical protein NQ318_015556 [Aromia moschata]|uniref:10 kDa heat shock protein, mitochondrial n=1 Tax=Aromia moschata TaxID=1265417 RepID=A0AAV8XK69_9CUCU|nr:hypothetical protein NQ318_015556 [Aromia moschata]
MASAAAAKTAAAAAAATTASKLRRVSPLFNRVLIRRHEPATQTAGGIVLPENTKERVLRGTVVAVGPGARNDAGHQVPMTVRPGDEVILPDYGGTRIHLDDEQQLYMFRESDILAKLHQQ